MTARSKFVRIEVKDKAEAENIQRAMADASTRAFVNIVGALLPFGATDRTRILTFVNDSLNDGAGRVSVSTTGDKTHVEASKQLAS